MNLHQPRTDKMVRGGTRLIELIVNGHVADRRQVPADGMPHEVRFDVDINRSSWVALRQFPQMHTNPVQILIGDKPIRASRSSALWCAEAIQLLWKNRKRFIREQEQPAARAAYDRAIRFYNTVADECPAGS